MCLTALLSALYQVFKEPPFPRIVLVVPCSGILLSISRLGLYRSGGTYFQLDMIQEKSVLTTK